MTKKLLYVLIGVYALGFMCGLFLILRQAPAVKPRMKMPLMQMNKDAVAVIQIYGPIYIKERSSYGFSANDSDRIVKRLRKISRKGDVKAVVLRINSPGGSVAAVQEICKEIDNLKLNKIVVVASLGDVAASGGYYIASQADKIIASPGTLTGSIGVILQLANVQELFKKIGVKMETVRSGKYKDIGSSYRELSPEERQIFQKLTDDAYSQFVAAVETGRKFTHEKALELADGRIYTGTQAKELGMLDDFGNSEDAIAIAAQAAGITGTPRIIGDSEPWEDFFGIFGERSEIMMMSDLLAKRKVRLDYMME
ncbi:MAG: signal peptide peptidase SppA [Elusimicrobiota bacterium]